MSVAAACAESKFQDLSHDVEDGFPGCWDTLVSFLNENYRSEDPSEPHVEFNEDLVDFIIEGDIYELRKPDGSHVGCAAHNVSTYVVNDGDFINTVKVMEVTLLCVNKSVRGQGWAKRIIQGIRGICKDNNITHAVFNGPKVGRCLFPNAKIMALSLLRETPALSFSRENLTRSGGQYWNMSHGDKRYLIRPLADSDLPTLISEFTHRAGVSPGFRRVFSMKEARRCFMHSSVSSWVIFVEQDLPAWMPANGAYRLCGFISFYSMEVNPGADLPDAESQTAARLYYSLPIEDAKSATLCIYAHLAKSLNNEVVYASSTGWHSRRLLAGVGFWPARSHDMRGEFLTPVPREAIGTIRGFDCETV